MQAKGFPIFPRGRNDGRRQGRDRGGGLGLFDQFFDAPYVARQAEFHGRGHIECGVDAAKIVVPDQHSNGCGMVPPFLAMGAGPSAAAAQVGTDGEVDALNITRGDFLGIGIANPHFFRDPEDWPVGAVHLLLEHAVMDITAKGIFHRFDISDVAVGCDLRAVEHTAAEITAEGDSVLHLPLADTVGDDRFAVRVQRQPQYRYHRARVGCAP